MNANENFISDYLKKRKPYKTVSQEIWNESPEQWGNILKLDWNESVIEPSVKVKQSILNYIEMADFFHLYPSVHNKELIEKLSFFSGVPEYNIQYFAGSDSLHEYIAKLYISAGDRVLLLWPSYDNFRSTCEANGADIIYSELDRSFCLDISQLKEDIRFSRPKIVYLCSPNNPTGRRIESSMVEMLLEQFPDTLFLVDEAYAEFAKKTVNSLVMKYENILVTHTMSKAFGLANIRFGYLAAPAGAIDAINSIRNPKNISTLSQVAAMAALDDIDYMWEYVAQIEKTREWLTDKINNTRLSEHIKAFDSDANFILIQCRDICARAKLYYSLREKKIYVRQLNQCPSILSCLRVTIGLREQMERLYNALCDILLGQAG